MDNEEKSQEYTYELMTESPPEKLKNSSDISNFGEEISNRFILWWKKSRDSDFSKQVPTYFGMISRSISRKIHRNSSDRSKTCPSVPRCFAR